MIASPVVCGHSVAAESSEQLEVNTGTDSPGQSALPQRSE